MVRSLGIENISTSQVSDLTRSLDELFEDFRIWELKAEYPFLWIDVVYKKFQGSGRVESMEMMIAT